MADVPQAMKTAYELNHESRVRLLQAGRDALKKIAPTGINATWAPQKRKLTQLITSEQETIAGRMAIAAVDTLAEQGEWIPTGHFINPVGFAGLAFSSDVDTVLDVPARTFKETFWKTGSYYQAYRTARDSLDRLIRTITADTERAAMGASVAIRPGVGYVRMVNMPACSRCIILAGKYFRWNEGFLRHPNCDCVHVPTKAKDFAQAQEMGLANDPYEVFKSLSTDMQERLFGRYGAEAIRDGADIFQVVNAQLNKKGAFTTYGTTRRAYAGARLKPNQRRQLPETIYKLAKGDRASAIKVLEEHGYIHPAGQIPTGAIRGQALGFGQYGKGGAARGASDAVLAALRSEVRDPSSIYTMTAAERRLFEARRDFLFVQQGINPYSEFALRLRGAPLISGYDKPLTPAIAAEVEERYFVVMQANGELTRMRELYRRYKGVSLSADDLQGLTAVATAEEIVLSKASDLVKSGSLLSGGGKPPKTPKPVPFDQADDSWDEGFRKADVQGPPISKAELNEVIAGYVLSEESMEHFYETHRYSADDTKKTFIPDEWTKEDYESATRAVIKSARYYHLLSDQITFRGEHKGVIMEVTLALRGRKTPKVIHSVPIEGEGVSWNDRRTGKRKYSRRYALNWRRWGLIEE